MDTVFKILDFLDVLVTLLLVVASTVTALQCGAKKLSTAPAWVLVAGFGVMLLVSIGYAAANLFVGDLGSANYKLYRAGMLMLYVVNLLGLAAVAAGIALFKPRPSAAAQEPFHG